jgi:peroxiredoxin
MIKIVTKFRLFFQLFKACRGKLVIVRSADIETNQKRFCILLGLGEIPILSGRKIIF